MHRNTPNKQIIFFIKKVYPNKKLRNTYNTKLLSTNNELRTTKYKLRKMETIICEKIARIIKNRKKLIEILKININNRGKEVTIDGTPENELIARQVIDALNFGFPYAEAISIKTEDRILETINIKDYTNRANLQRVRGRVIGKGGKTIKTLASLTDSAMELQENTVAIIATPENLERAAEAVIAIIKGAKQGGVYKDLEKSHPEEIIDLGLKERPMKTIEEYEKSLEESDN